MRDGVHLLHEGLKSSRLLFYYLEEGHDHALAEPVGRRETGELIDEIEVEGWVRLVVGLGRGLGVPLVFVAVEAFPHLAFKIYYGSMVTKGQRLVGGYRA